MRTLLAATLLALGCGGDPAAAGPPLDGTRCAYDAGPGTSGIVEDGSCRLNCGSGRRACPTDAGMACFSLSIEHCGGCGRRCTCDHPSETPTCEPFTLCSCRR